MKNKKPLTTEQIKEIQIMRSTGSTIKEIQDKFNIRSRNTIYYHLHFKPEEIETNPLTAINNKLDQILQLLINTPVKEVKRTVLNTVSDRGLNNIQDTLKDSQNNTHIETTLFNGKKWISTSEILKHCYKSDRINHPSRDVILRAWKQLKQTTNSIEGSNSHFGYPLISIIEALKFFNERSQVQNRLHFKELEEALLDERK